MRENLGFSGAVHSGAGHTSGVGKCMGSVSMNFNGELAIQGRGQGAINGKTNLPKKVTEVLAAVMNAMEFVETVEQITRNILECFSEASYVLDSIQSLGHLL